MTEPAVQKPGGKESNVCANTEPSTDCQPPDCMAHMVFTPWFPWALGLRLLVKPVICVNSSSRG